MNFVIRCGRYHQQIILILSLLISLGFHIPVESPRFKIVSGQMFLKRFRSTLPQDTRSSAEPEVSGFHSNLNQSPFHRIGVKR